MLDELLDTNDIGRYQLREISPGVWNYRFAEYEAVDDQSTETTVYIVQWTDWVKPKPGQASQEHAEGNAKTSALTELARYDRDIFTPRIVEGTVRPDDGVTPLKDEESWCGCEGTVFTMSETVYVGNKAIVRRDGTLVKSEFSR